MDPEVPERLHGVLMDFVRAAGLLHLEQTLPGHPVSLSQAFALHELDAGTETAISQRDLAERLGLEKSTVSRMVTDLEHKGMIQRERDPANRRLYRLRITDEGRTVHKGMAATVHEQYVQLAEAMTPAEREALLVGLPALIRVIRRTHLSPP